MTDIDTSDDRIINRKVRDIRDGAAGVILDANDNGRVKVRLITGTRGVRYYARKNAGNLLKPRHTFGC